MWRDYDLKFSVWDIFGNFGFYIFKKLAGLAPPAWAHGGLLYPHGCLGAMAGRGTRA